MGWWVMIGQMLAGRYLILKQLGAGGFSETYLARDRYLPRHPLCVVKWLKLSADCPISPETARRLFEGEARILGQLGQQNTQIPALLAYCSEAEQTYLVQEYIEGESLGTWVIEGRRLTSAGAIDLLLEVLPVLDYIHSQRIIHRDIKPNNLLRRQSDGKIVLIDFGAACCLAERASCALPDEEALAIGTPGYMPDEQQLGMAEFSTDLYALGISVIHLLTGIQPRQFQQDLISGELDWQTYVQNDLRQNSPYQNNAQEQSVASPFLEAAIAPPLVTFLDRMVRSRCHDRFVSAAAALTALKPLADQLKPGSKQQWAVKSRRKPLILKPLIALFALSLAAYLVYSKLSATSADVQLTLLREVPMSSSIKQMLISPDARTLITAGADRVLRLWSLPEGKLVRSLTGHQHLVTALYMSRDGRFLASSEANVIRLWNPVSGSLLQTFQANSHPVTAIAISSDAQNLISGSQDGTLQVWKLATGKLVRTLKTANAAITAIACGVAPNQIISASSNFQIQVWNLQTGERDRVFAGHQAAIVGLQVTDRRTLLSFGDDRTLVWDLESGALTQAFSQESAQPMTAAANQQHVVTVNQQGTIQVWAEQAGRFEWQASSQLGQGLEVVVSPDQQYLVSWQPNQRLQLWRFTPAAISR